MNSAYRGRDKTIAASSVNDVDVWSKSTRSSRCEKVAGQMYTSFLVCLKSNYCSRSETLYTHARMHAYSSATELAL